MRKGQSYWREHVLRMSAQGQSANDYAQEYGLVLATLRWWRSKLREEIAAQASSRGRFVAVRVGEAVPMPSERVRLTLGAQVHLEMPGVPSPQWLAMLARSIRDER